uniref:Signal peptidase complex subunit 3 n=1 Tax=Acanthochromis polyacanthus TaxID=80966 RepID=A0A3Q1F872_9TELE
MNTVLSRANSLFAFSLSVMAALTFGCFITTAFKDRRVPVDIHVSKVMLKNVDDFTGPRERSDLGFITFDLSADLQPIFDWNVKQLFLYLSAEYSTKSNSLNQVVLWDKIVLRGENTKLNLRDMKSKYFFFDDGNGLRFDGYSHNCFHHFRRHYTDFTLISIHFSIPTAHHQFLSAKAGCINQLPLN